MGRDKTLLELDGVPLFLRAARRMAEVADPVILAPGAPGRLGALGYAEVADQVPDAGPLGAIVAGLAAAPHRLLAVVAADMPHASPAVMALLARICTAQGPGPAWDAAVPVTGDGLQPLHAVFATSALASLRTALADGRLAMRDALADLRVAAVDAEAWRPADPSERFADNINTRDDLALLA